MKLCRLQLKPTSAKLNPAYCRVTGFKKLGTSRRKALMALPWDLKLICHGEAFNQVQDPRLTRRKA